jgi:PAS domain S-box-containing protein
MNTYLVLPLIQALFSLALIGVVLKGHTWSFTHRLFAIYIACTAIWGILIFAMRASPDIEHAYSWDRWLIPLAAFSSVIFYHFAIRYTAANIKRHLILSLYFTSLIFIPLAATPLVFSGMQIKPYGYAPIFGPAAIFWMLFSYGLLITALVIFIRSHRESTQAELKNRFAYIITGMSFALVGGIFDALPIFGLPLYPGLIIGNIAFLLLTTVAIVRHKLLDISIVARKSAVYLLVSALVAVPFVVVFVLATHLFREAIASPWIYVALILVLALALPLIWQTAQRWIDRLFYRDRYNYLRALETFTREAHSVTDAAKLGSTMVDLIAGALRVSRVYLLQPRSPDGDFTVTSSAGMANNNDSIFLKSHSPLVKWLKRSGDMLFCNDLEIIPQLQGVIYKETEVLEQMGAELLVPLKTTSGQLPGLLILGPKLSEQSFSIEDKQLIDTMSNQMAINLENARLYNDVLRARENLETWLDSMSDSVMIVNTDYSVQFVNKAAIDRFDTNVGDICWNALKKDKQCFNCPMQHYLAGSKAPSGHTSNVGGRQYDVVAAPMLNPDGSLSIIEVLRDITERKQMEEALRESEEHYRFLVELSPEAIFVASEGKHAFTNSAGLKLLGVSSPDQIIGKPVMDFIHPDYREIVAERMQKAIKTGKAPPVMEEKFVRLDGTVIDVEVKGAPLLYGGKSAMQVFVSDITERKRAQESLRLSEQNYRDSIENSLLGIRVLNKDGKTIYANRAILDMWGYGSIKELEAVPAKQRYTPESYDEHMKRIGDMKIGEAIPSTYEASIVRSDGQVRHVSASIRALTWRGKRQFQVVYQDITERKQAEAEYRTIIRTTMDGFWLTDMQGHFLDVNDAYCRLIGYSRDELLNMSIADVEAIEKPREIAKRMRKIKKVGYDSFETSHRRKDGGIVDVGVSINYLSVGGGRLFVFLRDITERKRVEEALRESEERFRTFFEEAPVYHYMVSPGGEILGINKASLEALGYVREEIVGKPLITTVYAPSSRKKAERLFIKWKETGKIEDEELNIVTKRGDERTILLSAHAIRDAEGEVLYSISVQRDITDRKRMEDEIIQSKAKIESLRRSEQLKTDLLSTVSHELRTPLTAIKGFATTLLRTNVKWRKEEQRDFLQNIDQETDRLTHLIGNLLDMSRLEAGVLSLEKESYQVSEILESVRNRLNIITQNHKLQLEIPAGVPPVFADKMRIGQVLSNLIENAAKYSKKGSQIMVGAESSDNTVIINVTDRGEGIPYELLDKVFERFYQREAVVTGRRHGMGLGLSICRAIVEAHEGKIWVESKVGKGSRFSFSLPASKKGD